MSKTKTSYKNGFSKFSDKAKVSNLKLLKNVIDYKKTLPKTDTFWKNISKELENLVKQGNISRIKEIITSVSL